MVNPWHTSIKLGILPLGDPVQGQEVNAVAEKIGGCILAIEVAHLVATWEASWKKGGEKG